MAHHGRFWTDTSLSYRFQRFFLIILKSFVSHLFSFGDQALQHLALFSSPLSNLFASLFNIMFPR